MALWPSHWLTSALSMVLSSSLHPFEIKEGKEGEGEGVCVPWPQSLWKNLQVHLALNSRTQRGGSTESLHIRLVLAIVHGVQRALVARDAELASHGLCYGTRVACLAYQRVHCFQSCPSCTKDKRVLLVKITNHAQSSRNVAGFKCSKLWETRTRWGSIN